MYIQMHIIWIGKSLTANLAPKWPLQLGQILHEQHQRDIRIVIDLNRTTYGMIEKGTFNAAKSQNHPIASRWALQMIVGLWLFVCTQTVSKRISINYRTAPRFSVSCAKPTRIRCYSWPLPATVRPNRHRPTTWFSPNRQQCTNSIDPMT